MSLFDGKPLVIASHNAGKVREIAALLADLSVSVTSAAELHFSEPDETGSTFVANATLKAEAACQSVNLPALADDSGLVVPALGGDPGIYSARWAGPEKDFAMAMEKVKTALQEAGEAVEAQAYFTCVLALARPGEETQCFAGEVWGRLAFPPRVSLGFGYDPIFVPDGYDITFGEMAPEEKHRISHRADAFRKFHSYLSSIASNAA